MTEDSMYRYSIPAPIVLGDNTYIYSIPSPLSGDTSGGGSAPNPSQTPTPTYPGSVGDYSIPTPYIGGDLPYIYSIPPPLPGTGGPLYSIPTPLSGATSPYDYSIPSPYPNGGSTHYSIPPPLPGGVTSYTYSIPSPIPGGDAPYVIPLPIPSITPTTTNDTLTLSHINSPAVATAPAVSLSIEHTITPFIPIPTTSSSAPAQSTHMFTLIKGNTAPDVFVLNNRGERFHVSETLMHEMQAGGSWYEPDVKPQAEVDKMALRFTVDSTANLGTINTQPTNNDLMLVKGDGGPLDDNTLKGNGRAVYAVNSLGQKFHVTGDGFDVLTKQNGGTPPAIATVTQNAVDSSPVAGTLGASGGALVTTNDPIMDQALASATNVLSGIAPASSPASGVITPTTAPVMPTPAVRVPDPATTVLTSGPFAGYTQAQVDTFAAGVNGTAAPAAAAPTPAPAAAAPAPAPAAPTDETLAVGNTAASTGQFRIVQGDATDWKPDDQLQGNGRAIWVVNAAGQKFHVTGDLMGAMQKDGTWHDPERLPQGAVDNMQQGSSVSLTNLDQLRSINIGAGSEFKLIKGADPSVYAMTSTGSLYHVDQAVAAKMGGAFGNIDTMGQDQVDKLVASSFKGEVKTVADLNRVVKDQSAAAGGFDGNTSGMPGGIPPIQGYTNNR